MDSEPYYFLLLADPHIGWTSFNSATEWNKCIRVVNTLHPQPDFAIILGDMVHGVHRGRDDVEEVVGLFKDSLDSLNVKPVHFVPGNHDVGNSPTLETLDWYRENYGPPYSSFLHRGDLFVLIDSNSLLDPSFAPDFADEQEAFLRETFSQSAETARWTSMFLHHSLHLGSASRASEGQLSVFLAGQRTIGLVQELAGEYPRFRWCFSGHLHHNDFDICSPLDLHAVTVGSCTSPLKQWFRAETPRGFLVCRASLGGIEYRFVRVEEYLESVNSVYLENLF